MAASYGVRCFSSTVCGFLTRFSILQNIQYFITSERNAKGKAKALVVPDGAPPGFFLRMKVKQSNLAG